MGSSLLDGMKRRGTQRNTRQKRTPLERDFKKKVKRKLDGIPGLYYFVKEAAAIRGIPDIIGCTKSGRFFAMELKKSKDEVYYKTKAGLKLTGGTKLQWHNIQKIRKAGGIADFVYPENLKDMIKLITSTAEKK